MSAVQINEDRDRRAAIAWDAYVVAKNQADHTLRLEDGLAAGKAWRTFLTLFQSAEQTEADQAIDAHFNRRRRA